MTVLSTTGQDVLDALPGDTIDDDKQIPFINAAIRRSFTAVKMMAYVSSVATIAASTPTYTPSLGSAPSPSRRLGYGRVFLTVESTSPGVLLRNVRQYYDDVAAVWKLVFPDDLVSANVGKTVDVQYQYPHANITALSDTILIDQAFLMSYVKWLQLSGKLEQQPTETRGLAQLVQQYYDDWTGQLNTYHSAQIALPIIEGYEALKEA